MKHEEFDAERVSEGVPTPLQSMSAINRVLTAMFSYKRPVMYHDISAACGLHPANVSQALSSSRDLGLTESAGRKGLYTLTQKGVEYARILTAGKEEEARLLMQKILKENPKWNDIFAFLDAAKGQSRDPIDLVLDIEAKLGKAWKPNMRNRIRDSLVSILEYAKLVQREGPNVVPVMEVPTVVLAEETDQEKRQIPTSETEFAELRGDDFVFQVRKDLQTLDFAESQFNAWADYLRKKLTKDTVEERRQSGGVPNQQP